MRQPVEAMADAALAMLLERIGGEGAAPRRVRLEPALIERASCAAPRSAVRETVAAR